MRSCLLLGAAALAIGAAAGHAQPVPGERNLLPNSSFETADGPLPADWAWGLSREARATASLDASAARSGRVGLKLTNASAQAPHVFGRLYRSVRLTRGRTYTLSCYVKSPDPGVAWIGAGRDWQFRFAFPRAADWTRVVGTFEAGAEEEPVMIVTESSTAGLWVDDVQLEPGSKATPYVFDQPAAPGESRLRLFQGEAASPATNLVANSSFETLDGGLPKGWTFDRRNTDAAMTMDATVSHSGRNSLRFTNHTAFGPHVYGLLSYLGGVPVEPNSTYTLSCYVKSDDPGIAWIGGGPAWLVRLHFPATEGGWRRVSRTFRTGPEERTWTLLVASESPTDGFRIDDVKLEHGEEATLYLPEEGADAELALLDVPARVTAGETLVLGGWLYSPRAVPQARVKAELTGAKWARPVAATWEGDLAVGPAYAELRYGAQPSDNGPCSLSLTVSAGGAVLAAARASFELHTVAHERQRLAETRRVLARVRRLYERARAAGADAAYPRVSLTVAENFADFVAEDLDHREVLRAGDQVDQINELLSRAERELTSRLDGKPELLVPRYVTGPIRIEGSSFVGTVQWPDGRREQRPVFFSGYGHFGAVRRDVEKFPAYGMNVLQVEVGPSATLPTETTESLEPIEDFAKLLDRAERSNVAVNLLLSPHYFPQWACAKWPGICDVDGGFLHFSVDAPEGRSIIERHLRLVASRLKGRPGLHSYCLSNEPIYVSARSDPNNRRKWLAYLTARYGDLQQLNAAHRAQYASFEAVPVPAAQPPQATPLYYDWCRFNNQRFAEWHRWMADAIHEVDPGVPVHAKIMNTVFGRELAGWGIDPELFCDLSQINGNDCCKWVSHGSGPWANGWQGENMFFDLLRSCKAQPIFNSENHVILDRDLDFVPAAHLRNILWQSAVHGEGASTMWVWERTFDRQSDFAGSIMHRPACADEHGRTALDLMRLAPEVTALQRAPAQLALVYSIASLIYSPPYQDWLSRVYQALNFSGEKIDFITERQLASGKAEQYQALLAPGVTHLPPEALEGLRRFDALPGRLIVTAGEGGFARDDLDREVRAVPLRSAAALPDLREAPLRDAIVALLTERGWRREVTLRDRATAREAWGVEWLWARRGGALLVNLVNYTQKPVTVQVVGPKGRAANLLTGERAGETPTLAPLEPLLLQYTGK